MSASRFSTFGLIVLAMVVFLAATVSAQHLRTSTDITGTGTINVKRDVVNTAAGAGTAVTISPTVVMNGNVGGTTQNITATVAGNDINFTTVKMQLASPKAVDTDMSVATDWQLGDGVTGLSGTVSFSSARTISVADASSYGSASSATLDFSGGIVAFTKVGGSQTVLNNSTGLAYGTLALSGTSTKSFQSTGAVAAATVTHAGGDLTVNDAFSITGSATLATIADVTAAMSIGAAASSASITAITNISTGSLTNNATGASLNIGTLSDNAGTITNNAAGGISFTATATNGTGTIETTGGGNLTFAALGGNSGIIRTTAAGGLSFTGAAVNTGAITGGASTGAIAFGSTLSNSGAGGIITAGQNGSSFGDVVTNSGSGQIIAGTGAFAAALDFNANVDNNGGTIQLGANGDATFAGNFVNSGTLNLNAGSDWTYDGAAQNIAGGGSVTYGNLLTAGSGTKTALGDITVAGNFDNGGGTNLAITTDMDTYALSVSGARDNTSGTLRLGGTNGFSFGTLLAAGGTVIYDGAGAFTQSLATGSYYNLQFEGSATKEIAGGVTVSTGNDVSLVSGVTMNLLATGIMNVGTGNPSVTGTLTLASGSTMSNAGDINITMDLDNSGSLSNTGTITVGY